MKKIAITLVILAIASSISSAQTSYWAFNYHISASIGQQTEYISDPSFRGWGIEGRGFLTDNISVGGAFSWEVFDQVLRGLPPTSVGNEDGTIAGAVTGTEYRYINTLPILVNSHYYIGESGATRLFVGVGVGTSYNEQQTNIGLIGLQNEWWGFTVQPEIGVWVPFGLTGVGANITGKMRYSTKASGSTAPPISFFTLGIGFGFMN